MIHLIAHRGNARDFPENTAAALVSAMDMGLRHVEFDVQLAADAIPVVIHDDELARTAGVPGSVFERAAAELTRIDAHEPSRFGERYRGIHVPLLSDIVSLLEQRQDVTAFVEVKRASLRHFGTERTLSQVLRELQPVRGRCVVISFDSSAIQLAKTQGFRIGWVLSAYDEQAHLLSDALRPEFLFCNHLRLPPEGRPLWPGSWEWAVYEVDTAQLAQALILRGVRFLETMAVAHMIEVIGNLAPSDQPSGQKAREPLGEG